MKDFFKIMLFSQHYIFETFLAVNMEGCLEAPIQLTITIYLIMTGVRSLPWDSTPAESYIYLGQNKITFTALPLLTLLISAVSIMNATMTLNVTKALLIKFPEGYLPFFCHTLLFRVMSFAFFFVYLDNLAAGIVLLILVANLSIGYRLAPEIGVPKTLNEYLLHDSKSQSPPIWLNGFLGIITPSWYLNIFDTSAIKKAKKEQLVELLNKCTTSYIRESFNKKEKKLI